MMLSDAVLCDLTYLTINYPTASRIPQLKSLYQINLVRRPTQALLAVQLVENQVIHVSCVKCSYVVI